MELLIPMTAKRLLVAPLAAVIVACSWLPAPRPAPQPTPTPTVTPQPTPTPAPTHRRSGAVRPAGVSSVQDDAGAWNALGTSLFWAIWGEANEPARLEQNLAFAASSGFDYIRILGMVGTDSWRDRAIDPKSPSYWATVDALLNRLERHGLRAQVTVFADAQAMMPDMGEREVFADTWAAKVESRRDRFVYVEVANEYWQNGLSLEELRGLARRMNARTDVLIAASSPACGSYPEGSPAEWQKELEDGKIDTAEQGRRVACAGEWTSLYGSGAADLMTFHFDRDVSKADGSWRPVRQPWEMQFGAFATGVKRYANQEPIGPESSVAADDNPERLTMAAVITWLSRGAFYTLHTGAGIRGGGQADRDRGRSVDLWDVANIRTTAAALEGVRKILPAMQDCSPKNGHWSDAPMRVSNLDAVTRAYQTICSDGTFVATLIGVRAPVTLELQRAGVADFSWYSWTGEYLNSATAVRPEAPGANLFIGPFAESVIVVGRFRPTTEPDWCSTKTEDQLRNVRMDLGGVRLSVPVGRAGGYFFTPMYASYSSELRALARREYKARGYTHIAMGGIVNRYPGLGEYDYRDRPAEYVALLEELWRDDLIPVHWAMVDGPYNVEPRGGDEGNPIDWSKVEAELTPLYQRADIQRVVCMSVAGWEVTDNGWVKTIAKAVALLEWQARVFPKAYRYWHATVDNGAPCNYGIDGEGCEGKAWLAMAPYLHGQMWQTGNAGGWNFSDPDSPEARRRNFLSNLRYEVMRFHTGHYREGGVRGADGKLLDVICGEYSAFFELNSGMTEDEAREFGRLAMTVPGVRGFGDGGR